MTEITLPSGRKIGAGHPPYIICEIGSNWSSFEDCKNSVALAKQCGADAIKFQLFTHESLFGQSRDWTSGMERLVGGQNHSAWDCTPPYLNPHWLPKLKEKADACGIEFMCSAFSPELYSAVDPYVNVHKVASAELTHVRILDRLRKLRKPVILSTGASGEADIRQALEILQGVRAQPTPEPVSVVLMYCVAAYPAQEIELGTIELLRNRFGVPVGYSDHSLDVGVIPSGAVKAGACVIEKHFAAVPEMQSPDRGHSLNPDQFKRMVQRILGKCAPVLGAAREESPMILRHNRRLIATRDIAEGEALKEGENMGIYRSLKDDTKAASPWLIDQMNGKRAKRAIAAGDGIAWEDV